MNSIKLLHTGDLHLGSPMQNMGARAMSRKAELLDTLSDIVSLAKTEEVDAVLLAGDLFDTNKPDAETADRVYAELERLGDIKVFAVLGNHDYCLDFSFPPNVYLFNDYIEKIPFKDADIYGVSFGANHCEQCIVEGLVADDDDRVNILLVHGDVGADGVYNPISADCIKRSKMDYIALGHQHTCVEEQVGGTTVAYCGIPEGRAFDECGEKGVIIATIGKGYADCRFVPLAKRQYITLSVDITGAQDNIEIAERVTKELGKKENAYCVILKGEKSTFVDCDFIRDYIEKDWYYAEVEDVSQEAKDEGYTLKNLFMEKCKNENALKYGISALRGEKVEIV